MNDFLGTGQFEFKNRRPIHVYHTVTTNVTLPERNKFYLGAQIGYSSFLKHWMISPGVLFVSKKNIALDASFDVMNGYIQAGIYWKIHKKIK
jgi:hypothetical protein